MTTPRRFLGVAACGLAALALAGCTADAAATGAGSVAVTSTNTTCDLSATSAPAGTVTFTVRNSGDKVTEFYVLGADGTTVLGEAEDIGPGTSRDLKVTVDAGSYVAACKPGMTGDGIRVPFTVTG